MATTEIAWTQVTWNPVRGCQRVSPGCGGGVKGPDGEQGGCYAETMAARIVRMGGYEWNGGWWVADPTKSATPASRANADKYRDLVRLNKHGKAQWTGTFAFDVDKLDEPLRRRAPTMYFVNSMSDWAGDGLSFEQMAALFGVMAACPQHTFQLLTKRADRMLEFFRWLNNGDVPEAEVVSICASNFVDCDRVARPWPLPNVWLGVSCERQKEADERIPLVLQCPAAIRWVSAEPLLGHIDLFAAGMKIDGKLDLATGERRRLDWVVWGGESGHGARLCDVEWIRDGVRQCRTAGTPAFVKQLGAACYDFATATAGHLPDSFRFIRIRNEVKDKKGADLREWPEDLRVRQWPHGFTPPKSKALPLAPEAR
jgi:protein gp37